MVADYKSKLFLHWILIAFLSIYNVQTEGRIFTSQSASWIESMKNCQNEMLDMMCVSDHNNLTNIAQYLMKEEVQSIWVKNNAIIQFSESQTGCIRDSIQGSSANKTCASPCISNCAKFCILRSSNYYTIKDGNCFCFTSEPSYHSTCNLPTQCNKCNANAFTPVYRIGRTVEYCTHITIKDKTACMEQTFDCDKQRPVLCNKGAKGTNCGVKIDIQIPESSRDSLRKCVNINEQNIIHDQNNQESQKSNNDSTTSSGSVIVPIVAVVAVVVVVTIIMVAVILIHKRRKRPKGEEQSPTNRDLPNNTTPNLYTDLSNEDNYQCASEYDYIKESGINQNAKYNKHHTNQYEASNNLGNNYFILEPQDKSGDQVATDADDDGEYVDKVEGDYHHLNETTERKDAISKEDNLYDHGQNNKGSDGTYDTTNTIKDNIDVSDYNTIDSVKDDGTYNKLA